MTAESVSAVDLSGISVLLMRCASAGGTAGAEGAAGAPDGAPNVTPALFDLRYEGGTIRDIGALEPRPGERVVDLNGAYLCAGLVDAHVHVALGGPVAANAAAHLAHGVTAVRDLGGCFDPASVGRGEGRLREGRGPPAGELPRVVSSLAALTRRGHYGAFLGVALGPADDPAEAVRERVAAGAAVVKVILTGSVDLERGTATSAHFSFAELRSMVGVAHDLGVAVAVHANGAEAVRTAAEAGADSIEHGILIDEDAVRAMVDHDVVWVPTLTPLHALACRGESGGEAGGRRTSLPRIITEHEAMVAAARAAGVRVAAGTDGGSPGVPHGALLAEVAHLRSAGFSPAEARTAACAVGADLLGLGGGYGGLSVGAVTDLVWFEQDPFVDSMLDRSRAFRPLGVLPEPGSTPSAAPGSS